MSNYTKLTNFATKDSLPTGDPAKIVKGTEIDDEFASIQTVIATKADLASPALTGIPTVPTAVSTTNTTQAASCAFVQAAATSIAQTEAAAAIANQSADIDVNSVSLGDWTVQDNGSTLLKISYNGTDLFQLDSTGNLTVIGNITAYGTI